MAYTPKHYYRGKDDLSRGDPNKRVRGSELSDEFEAISSDLRKVRDELNAEDSAINEINVEIDNINQNITNIEGDITDIKVDVENNKTEINELRDEFENHDHALDDLSDVTSKDPKKDDLLVWTGQNWISTDFAFIETTLRFKGGIDMTGPAPANPENGDLWVNDKAGMIDASWGEISGREVLEGKFVGWADSTNRWHLLGDMANVGVTKVLPATGVTVDDSKPSEPVVGLDRDELDKWYEPRFGKNTAFNKDFGTTAGTVAEGNHNHDLDYADINHDHDGVYEPVIDPKNTAFNKNFGTTSGTVSEGDHTHSDYADVDHDHNGVYEPVIDPKKTAFNKDFGTTAGTVAEGNHDHKLNDLSDVNAASPTRDDLLVWNGSVWEANDFDFIQTALNFKGGINVANAAPSAVKGDLYVNDTEGPASGSWTGIAGRTVKAGNFIGYANSRWYLLGDMADIGVTDVLGGLGISVDDSKPSEPVVNIDRDEVDKWYASPEDILWEQNGNDIYYNSGNVGIGTDNPLVSLQINTGPNSNLGFYDTTTGLASLLSFNDGGARIPMGLEATSFKFTASSVDALNIDSSGRVGIGGQPSRSAGEIAREAKDTLARWKSTFDVRLKAEPKADKKAVTLEITGDEFSTFPTEETLVERLQRADIGGGDAKLQVAGDGYFSGFVDAGGSWVGSSGRTALAFSSTSLYPGVWTGQLPNGSNGGIDLGNTSFRFKDGYFSGTVNATTINGKVTDVADHIKAITPTQIANWDAGTGGGGGSANIDARISDDQIIHWDQAYGWGNHADAGYQPAGDYLTPSSLNGYATESWVTSNYQPKGSYLTSIAAGNGTKVTGNKVEMSGSYTGTFTVAGDGDFSGTVTANKVDATMAIRSSTLTGGVVGGFYADTTANSTGQSNANLKSWSKLGTGLSEGFWQVVENFFAGNAFCVASSAGSVNKGAANPEAGSKLFESRKLQQWNQSFAAANSITSLMCMIDHGFDKLQRSMRPEQEEMLKRNEEIRQRLIDKPMERVDESCQDCWVYETEEGKVALLVPVVADYDFACSSHGEFNLIKKTRSQLPDLNELFDLWRLDGKNIVVDVDQAREYAKGVLKHEARFRFCHAEADDFLFGVSRKGEMRDMVQGLMAEIDKADLAALDNLVGRLRNDGSETYAFKEYLL